MGGIHDHADAMPLGIRQNGLLDFRRNDRIGRLQRGDGCDGSRAAQLVHIEIGYADPAHYALALQLRHGRPAFLDIFFRLGPVNLIQVDRVQLKTAKAGFHFAADGVRLEALANLAALVPHAFALGEDQRFAGAALKRAGHHFFGMAQAVDRGRVDPVQPRVQRGVDGRYRFVVVLRSPGESPTPAAHGPRADANGREVHVAVA